MIAVTVSTASLLAVTHSTWAASTDPDAVAPSPSPSPSPSDSTIAPPSLLEPEEFDEDEDEGVISGGDLSAKPKPAFTVVFSDDFNGATGTLPSDKNWQFGLGTSYPGGAPNWGTGEIQTYTKNPANISLDGAGHLRITPLRAADGTWTSGRIESQRDDFKAPEGGAMRVKVRLKLPSADGGNISGYWPAVWMLGEPFRSNFQNWPTIGEIDVMENVNSNKQVFGTLHCGTNPGGPCGETTGIAGRTTCGTDSCRNGFHTFAVEWDRTKDVETLRWSIDKVRFHQIREDELPAETWASFTTHKGFFLLLNVAMGGGFPAADDAASAVPGADTTPGRSMIVDRVSVSIKKAGR